MKEEQEKDLKKPQRDMPMIPYKDHSNILSDALLSHKPSLNVRL